MRWLLGKESGQDFLPADWSQDWASRWEREFNDSEVVYGGFLWGDLENFEETLGSLHSRLLCDFEVGWSAVALTARTPGGEPVLGPFTPPTTARPHLKAPQGLYLLGGQRLLVSLTRAMAEDSKSLELAIHHQQPEYGPVFCDPNLEVRLPHRKDRDFNFLPLTRWQKIVNVGKALAGR